MNPPPVETASTGGDLFPIFAHQGGWDELLLVAVPLAVLGLLLVVANRRVSAKLREQNADHES